MGADPFRLVCRFHRWYYGVGCSPYGRIRVRQPSIYGRFVAGIITMALSAAGIIMSFLGTLLR